MKSKSFENRSRSRERFDERQGKREQDHVKEPFKHAHKHDVQSSTFYSFSRSNDKIPGLGDSPPVEEDTHVRRSSEERAPARQTFPLEERPYARQPVTSDEKHNRKPYTHVKIPATGQPLVLGERSTGQPLPHVDRTTGQPFPPGECPLLRQPFEDGPQAIQTIGTASRYPTNEKPPLHSFEEKPPLRLMRENRSPSWGQERKARSKSPKRPRGDYRRSIENDYRRNEDRPMDSDISRNKNRRNSEKDYRRNDDRSVEKDFRRSIEKDYRRNEGRRSVEEDFRRIEERRSIERDYRRNDDRRSVEKDFRRNKGRRSVERDYGRNVDRRSIERDFKRNEDKGIYDRRREDDKLYVQRLGHEQGDRVREPYPTYESHRNRSRSPGRQIRIESSDQRVVVERHESVTPTKDEVSDRLGLEDISSPEDHDHRGDDYRLRAYGKDDDRYRKYKNRDDDFKYGDSRTIDLTDRLDRERGWCSPDRLDSPARQHKERFLESHDNHGPREHQGPRDIEERRIISISKKDKKLPPVKDYGAERRDYTGRRESSPREDDRYSLGSRERRSIVIEKMDKKVAKRTSPGSDRYEEHGRREILNQKEGKWKKTFRNSRSRSREYSLNRDDQHSQRSKKDVRDEHDERRQVCVNKRREDFRSRSRSPQVKQKWDDRHKVSLRDREDTTYKRVIAVKPMMVDSKENLAAGNRVRDYDRGQKENNASSRQGQTELQSDIFADLPPPKASKSSEVFSTYVPRAVKLKQQNPAGINPESRPPEIEQKVQLVHRREGRNIDVQAVEDIKYSVAMKDHDSNIHNDPRFKFRPKSPPGKGSSSKHRSRSKSHGKSNKRKRSRSRSRSHKRSQSRSRRRSRSRSRRRSQSRSRRRSRSRSRKRNRSRSRKRSQSRTRRSQSRSRRSRSRSRRSRSRDRYRKKDAKHRKRSYSSSKSRSRSHEMSSSSKKTKTDPESDKKPVKVVIPKADLPNISSRWDSPEEKKSRWGQLDLITKFVPQESVTLAQEKIANMLAAHLICKSPPPHRRMKPEEKAALAKKWKELSPSPLQEESGDEVANIVKFRAQDVLKRLFPVKTDTPKRSEVEKESAADEAAVAIDTKGLNQYQKYVQLQSLRSKWDSDSDSRSKAKRSKSRSRSSERKSSSKSKKKEKEKRDTSESGGDRSKSRSKKSKKKAKSEQSVSRSIDKSRSRSRDGKARSRSKERRSMRDDVKDLDQRSSKRSRRDSSKGLQDVASSKKESEQKDVLFHKEHGKYDRNQNGGSASKNHGRTGRKAKSRSPKSKKSHAAVKGKLRPTVKSKWSNESDSSDDAKQKSKRDSISAPLIPKDSLTQLEDFYNKLKHQDKLKKMSGIKK